MLQGYQLEGSAAPCVVINGKSLTFSFALDALEVVAQLSQDFLPPLPNDKVRTRRCCIRRWHGLADWAVMQQFGSCLSHAGMAVRRELCMQAYGATV